MYYIIQENTFNEAGHIRLLASLERLGLEHEVIKVLPFVEELEFKTTRKDVFVFGGMKLARLAPKYGWHPGALMTPDHDFVRYRNYYQEDLLNFDSKVVQFQENFSWDSLCYFIRPCLDTKAFTGDTYDVISWGKFRYDALNHPENYSSQLTPETLIQVASVKRTRKEFRFWVVDNKIITASQYKQGFRTYYSADVDLDAWLFCKRMIKVHSLAKAFVMDVCLTDQGHKIVELGCINCAGFYEADMQKLVIALESTYNS